MQAWEYMFTDIREGTPTKKATEKEMHNRLNEYGKQGWECFSIKEHREYNQVIAYFKRPVEYPDTPSSYPQTTLTSPT